MSYFSISHFLSIIVINKVFSILCDLNLLPSQIFEVEKFKYKLESSSFRSSVCKKVRVSNKVKY